jgi:hypothetical protein
MKQQLVWCATARARRVFPVPGGPYNNTLYNNIHIIIITQTLLAEKYPNFQIILDV